MGVVEDVWCLWSSAMEHFQKHSVNMQMQLAHFYEYALTDYYAGVVWVVFGLGVWELGLGFGLGLGSEEIICNLLIRGFNCHTWRENCAFKKPHQSETAEAALSGSFYILSSRVQERFSVNVFLCLRKSRWWKAEQRFRVSLSYSRPSLVFRCNWEFQHSRFSWWQLLKIVQKFSAAGWLDGWWRHTHQPQTPVRSSTSGCSWSGSGFKGKWN